MFRHRASLFTSLFSLALLTESAPAAHAAPARVNGVALPRPAAPARPMLEPARRPEPEPGDPEIRLAIADSILHPPVLEGLPFGATWIDLDGDGDPELNVPLDRVDPPSLLVYRQVRGQYQDIAADLGLGDLTQARSAVWLDLDDDGDLDLYVTRRSDADGNRLYENVRGRLVVVPGPTPASEPASDVSQAWADYDRDGDFDLYLGGVLLTTSRLFRNEGDLRFTDVTVAAGLDTNALTVSPVWSDFDNDGDADLSLGGAFDYRLFVNQGNGTFVEAVLPIVAPNALLVNPTWGDVDLDGDLDLLIGGLFPSFLLENKFDAARPPGEWFANRNSTWGTSPPQGSGGNWADLDLDGDLDLLAESGSRGWRLFENRVPEGGKLTDLSAALGLEDTLGITWHPSTGDYDEDGLVDVFSAHERAPHLYHNVSVPGGLPLRLHLVPLHGGVALGARVRFENAGRLQVREIAWPASGFSFPSPDLSLSVVGERRGLSVDVRWPGGTWERFDHLRTNHLNRLVEGKGDEASPAASAARATLAPTGLASPALELSCNPCRETVRFAPQVAEAASPTWVFDATGRRVHALAAGATSWDLRDDGGRRVPAGIYWLRGISAAVTAAKPTRVVVLP